MSKDVNVMWGFWCEKVDEILGDEGTMKAFPTVNWALLYRQGKSPREAAEIAITICKYAIAE
jgi:hypothetical protein